MATENKTELVPFKRLTSFKIDQVANALSRHGELVYQEAVGLRLDEARVLGAVLSWQPIALKDLSQALSLSKSQCSRLVSNMVKLGLLNRHDDPMDQRSFYLNVTDHGLTVLKIVNDLALERNRQLCELLTEEERVVLDRALDKLAVQVGRMQDERIRQGLGKRAGLDVESAGSGRQEPKVLLVDRQKAMAALRELQQLLDVS